MSTPMKWAQDRSPCLRTRDIAPAHGIPGGGWLRSIYTSGWSLGESPLPWRLVAMEMRRSQAVFAPGNLRGPGALKPEALGLLFIAALFTVGYVCLF